VCVRMMLVGGEGRERGKVSVVGKEGADFG
jgi:hypothetical protein